MEGEGGGDRGRNPRVKDVRCTQSTRERSWKGKHWDLE